MRKSPSTSESLLVAWLAEGQWKILTLDAATVIHHPDQVDAALAHLHVDALAAGIDGVLQQFLHDTGGPLDDLAGGDLVDQGGRQLLNARHWIVHGQG